MTERSAAMPVLAAARRRADLLLALGLGLGMQLELAFVDAPSGDVLIGRVMALALTAAVAVRRALPELAAGMAIGGVIGLELVDETVSETLILPFFVAVFVAYSVGAHADGRRLAASAAILFGGVALGVWLDGGGTGDFFFGLTIIAGGPVLLGRLVRARVRLSEALDEKRAAVEHERAARAAAAVVEERTRIAGELHHVVSDALAAMVRAAADAECKAPSQPDVAERSFAAIESTGREALGQIRLLLGVLRREDEELALAPLPSLAHVADLVARMRAAGLQVELEIEGVPVPLTAGLDLTAYRVVQEALACALAAGGRRSATVRLRYRDEDLALEVLDAGEAGPDGDRRMLGMHERVTLYGGELVTEPRGAGGYAVLARLPLERAA